VEKPRICSVVPVVTLYFLFSYIVLHQLGINASNPSTQSKSFKKKPAADIIQPPLRTHSLQATSFTGWKLQPKHFKPHLPPEERKKETQKQNKRTHGQELQLYTKPIHTQIRKVLIHQKVRPHISVNLTTRKHIPQPIF